VSVEKNKTCIRRIVEEVYNKKNLEIIPELIDRNFIFRSPGVREVKGPEGFKRMVADEQSAFPDVRLTINDMVAEGDRMAVSFTYAGTHKGEFLGIPPTGKKFSLPIVILYRFKDGKEAEAVIFSNQLNWFRQIGVSPPG
jgi:steroid delta-isomerase-like uncharacterized protein